MFLVKNNVVDRHRVDADPDPDQDFHFDADPDPDWLQDLHMVENRGKNFYFYSQQCQITMFSFLVKSKGIKILSIFDGY